MFNEEIRNEISLSSNNIHRIITPNTHPETETLGQANIYESSNNQNIYNNNKFIEKDISSNNKIVNKINNKRKDRNGNEICKNGKQRVTFADKIKYKRLVDIVNIQNFKQYNRIEEVSSIANYNRCCIII